MVPNRAWADMDFCLHQHARRGGGTKHANCALTAHQELVKQIRAIMLDFVWHSMADEHVNLAYTSHRSQITTCSVRWWAGGPFGSSVLSTMAQLRLAIGTAAPGLPSGEASCA